MLVINILGLSQAVRYACRLLRLAWYAADWIRIFDSKTNRTADSIRDSNEKNDSQFPTKDNLFAERL